MFQTNPTGSTGIASGIGYSQHSSFGGDNHYFSQMQQQAQACPRRSYGEFFQQNRQQIADRCRGRDPHGYRTDQQGCRWENNRPAQTQVLDQTATSSTIQAGNNRLTFNKADSSLRIQNSDGTEQNVDLKFWGDPHVTQNGRELGTIKKDLALTLKDGTQVSLLMGDGNGGKPQPGAASYLDSAAIRSPDGTGALVTGISGPGNLGVTPLDSSHSSEFMAGQAMNRFGHYEPSQVSVDRNGNMIDQSTGQVVHDQNGLNRLDQEQGCQAAAQSFWHQGYVPRDMADDYDRPVSQYTQDMQQSCLREMQRMFQQFQRMTEQMPGLDGLGMLFARYGMQGMQGMSFQSGILA